MRSEHMSKSLLNVYHITKILPPLWEIVVAEHDGESVFRPEAVLTLFLHMCTK